MDFLINVISFFWFVRTIKFVLFWIYLWQLKEYHVGRFLDHFKTYKGKKLLFGIIPIIKFVLLIFLLISYYAFPLVFYILLLVYVIETALFVLRIMKKQLKKPILTSKTAFLTSVSFAGIILYVSAVYIYIKSGFWFTFSILVFDVLTPLIVSVIVLLFQPFFVLIRNNTLKKAKRKIEKFNNLIVIGITGSYGKTSTKEFLKTILSEKFNVLATHEHQNSEIGIANCILDNLNEGHHIFIVEMGSYKKGGINLLCRIVKPKIGIVTGVNEQHLALFGSLENLLSAEGGQELADSLPKDGLVVLNGDNKYCLGLYKKINLKKKIYTVNHDKINSDIWTEDIAVKKDSIFFIAMSQEKDMANFNVNVLGKQNVQNLLGAILVAKELEMSFDQIAKACKNIQQKQTGMTLKDGIYGIDIIDSSHSANPDGVMADLDYLDVFSQKKVIVMPCLIELGIKSSQIHEDIGRKIAEVCDLAIITTKDQFEDIKKGALENGMIASKILFCENPKEIFNAITTFCSSSDAVLLEGRVHGELIKLLTKNKKH